jgi:hypothetical protein
MGGVGFNRRETVRAVLTVENSDGGDVAKFGGSNAAPMMRSGGRLARFCFCNWLEWRSSEVRWRPGLSSAVMGVGIKACTLAQSDERRGCDVRR